MQPQKIAFKNKLEHSINSYEYFKFEEYSDETHTRLMNFWITRSLLSHNIRLQNDQKVTIFA